jgi:hypothetical protein
VILKYLVIILSYTTEVFIVTILCTMWRLSFSDEYGYEPPEDIGILTQ